MVSVLPLVFCPRPRRSGAFGPRLPRPCYCILGGVYDILCHIPERDFAAMRSERLLSIMLLLQTRGQLPASELAGRLEVSVRTIMRDVEALSAVGVPVYTVRGPAGGVALLPGYRTDVTGLTADEARALFVLLSGRAHADLGLGQAIGSALRKVMAPCPPRTGRAPTWPAA